VIRGGNWYRPPWICRPAYRYGLAPEFRLHELGFRVATVQE
jgi:formylglycine-generating enzyme required for sulfatase activity